jgi:hypothetical protein
MTPSPALLAISVPVRDDEHATLLSGLWRAMEGQRTAFRSYGRVWRFGDGWWYGGQERGGRVSFVEVVSMDGNPATDLVEIAGEMLFRIPEAEVLKEETSGPDRCPSGWGDRHGSTIRAAEASRPNSP